MTHKFSNITLFGDFHGNTSTLKNFAHRYPDRTIVGIGDCGVGFPGKQPTFPANFRFFRGNHDNPSVCWQHPQYIHDYGMYSGMFVVAGASSIDRDSRTVGVDWWSNEELTNEQQGLAIDAYADAKPSIIASHEAPNFLHSWLASGYKMNYPHSSWPEPRGTRTGYLLERMIRIHQPKYAIFGHWHVSCRICINGCWYICLGIDEYLDLETLDF